MRRKAKAINFGIIYGISQYGLAKQINVSNHEADEFLNAYFLKFPEIKIYMDNTIKFCRKSGYVNNIFGRRSHFNGINDKNFNVRNFQERAAINAPIQGSASEIMRLAMIRLNKKFESIKNNKSKILLQIHDELIFEVPVKEVKNITEIIKDEMTSVTESDLHTFSTPLTVDVNTGTIGEYFINLRALPKLEQFSIFKVDYAKQTIALIDDDRNILTSISIAL